MKAYHQLLEISESLRSVSYERVLVSERYTMKGFERTNTDNNSVSIKNLDYTQMSHDWLMQLSRTAREFVLQHIFSQLKLNNLLWHYPTPRKSSEKAALAELTDHKVLFRTEVPGIYLVNPTKIWRGSIVSATECTKQLLKEHKRPSVELIQDLRSKPFIERDYYNLLKGNGFTPNMLEEQRAPYGDNS